MMVLKFKGEEGLIEEEINMVEEGMSGTQDL